LSLAYCPKRCSFKYVLFFEVPNLYSQQFNDKQFNVLTLLKMFCYRFPVFTARRQLAAIDWNYHKDLPANELDSRPGEVMVSRKYNQRTKSWDSKIIKKAKDYAYVILMVAKILDSRMADKKSVKWKVQLGDDDPRRISATIAEVAPEDSRTLHQRKVSRFQNC
jgi:hypothetical protein